MISKCIIFLLFSALLNGGDLFPYIYFDRDKVLLSGIDFETTLDIAELELAEGGGSSVITIWAIRDQIIPPEHAARINDLYLRYIDDVSALEDRFSRNFGVWHFAWAIANIYRHGDDEVKAQISAAYEDAKQRPATLQLFERAAERHVNGEKIYMGDAHELGRRFAQTHIVIPGNPDYIQDIEDYYRHQEEEDIDCSNMSKELKPGIEAYTSFAEGALLQQFN